MHIINRPSIPYWGHIPEGLHPGTVIEVDGHIPHHCSKFEISLFCGSEVGLHAEKHSNVALQIRPKIHSRKVICNSRQFGNWGHKEKHRDFAHLHHGSGFSMQIIVEQQHYRVVINGQNVCFYHHRVPFHEVRVFNIEGHVEVHRIEYKHAHMAGHMPTAPPYPSAPTHYVPPSTGIYPQSRPVYPSANIYPQQTVYPAPPPVYVAPVQPAYIPPTVIIEEGHHHHHHGGHHHGGHGIIDAIFGHDHHHGHHDSHHHGHHGHHGGHHW